MLIHRTMWRPISAEPPDTMITAQPGLKEALHIYASTADARTRAAIYAHNISPAFRDANFKMGPLLASNSLGSLAGDLVTQRALSLLKQRFPALRAIATDFSDASVQFGSPVTTRIAGIPSVSNYVPGTGYVTSSATTTDVSVTIACHKGVEISFNANELASTSRDLFGEQVEAAHYALGKALYDAIFSLITVSGFPHETVSALVDFKREKVSSIATALYDRGVSDMKRFLLLKSSYFEKLQNDTSIVSFASFQRPEIITDYALPPISGLQPYVVPGLPSTDSLVGFAGTRESLILATRVPNDYTSVLPGANNGNVSVVTNPDSGISVQLVQFVDHNKAAAFWRIALMFGAAKGNPAAGQRIVSAATGS